MAQTITYNDYTFNYNTLTAIHRAEIGDDGRTVIGTRSTFRISGVLTGDSTTDGNLGVKMQTMRAALHQPRKEFLVQESIPPAAPFVLYEVNYNDGDDDAYGPIPGDLRIEQFAGGIMARYTWELSTFKKECANQCSKYLYLAYRYDHVLDVNGMVTRTINGKLVMRGGNNADDYRNAVTPLLTPNYKRISQAYNLSEDGRTLLFSVTDEEIKVALPNPITDGQASFTVSTEQSGSMARAVLAGYFQAPRSTAKADILTAVVNLGTAKFGPVFTNPDGQNVYFEHAEVKETLFGKDANRIDFTFVMFIGAQMSPAGLVNCPLFQQGMPATLGQSWVGPYGATGAYWEVNPTDPFDGCIKDGNGNPPSMSTGQTTGSTTANIQQDVSPPTNATGAVVNKASTTQQNAPYISYHEKISFELDSGITALYPKIAGATPLLCQTRIPVLRAIQGGYARRVCSYSQYSTYAKVVPAALVGSQGTTLHRFVEASNPEPMPDGVNCRFTVTWRYIQIFTDQTAVNFDTANLPMPFDPRTQTTIGAIALGSTVDTGATA